MPYQYQDQSGYYYYSEMGYRGPSGQMLNMQMGNFGPMRGRVPFQNNGGHMGNFQRWPMAQMSMESMPNLTYHGQMSSIPKQPQQNQLSNSNCDQENRSDESSHLNNTQRDKMPLGNEMPKEIVPVNNMSKQSVPVVTTKPMLNTNMSKSNMPVSNMPMSNMSMSNMPNYNIPNGQTGMLNQQMGNMSYPQAQMPNMTYHGYQNYPMARMRAMTMGQMSNSHQNASLPYYQNMYAYQQYGQYGQQPYAQQQYFQQYASNNQQMKKRIYNQQQINPAPVRCTSTDVDGSASSVSSISPHGNRTW